MARCRTSSLRVLAITQIVIGALVIILGILCVVTARHWTSYIGFGIWTGIWVVITGILGVLGAKNNNNSPNKCLIGCFMGFSITACVISGIMFICYGFAVSYFSEKLCMYHMYGNEFYSSPYGTKVGAGLSSCQLIFSIVEFFIALVSSISCCSAICFGASAGSANQQVLYMHPGTQQIYSGGQSGVVIIQPTGAVAIAWPPDFTNAGQQTVFIPQQQPSKEQEMPPPYPFTETGNVPSSATADGAHGVHAGTVQV